MKRYLPLLIGLTIFFLLKITNLGIRLSDTNIYFYTGYQLLQGKVLYKDIFFTNFPLLPYISAFYFLLVGKNLTLFYLTAVIEVIAVSLMIYCIVYNQTKKNLIATTAAMLYPFSFIVLSTSDHQTGVFIASLFAILSYHFFIERKYLFSGIFIAAAILTKAYFLPILATYAVIFLLKREKKLLRFFVGFSAMIFLLLLPTLLAAPHALYNDVIGYSLGRSQGIPKGQIAWFFVTHDFVFFILLLFSLWTTRKHLFIGVMAIFSILFFFLYKDTYYLYLNFAVPFLCLAFPLLAETIQKHFPRLAPSAVPIAIFIFLGINLLVYNAGFRTLQKIDNLDAIQQAVLSHHPSVLYGQNDLTPTLAYLTKTPMLDGIVDTNENIFRKGVLNAKQLTADAIKQHAMLVAHGAYYPQMNFRQDLVGEIFDTKAVAAHCKLIKSFPVTTEGVENMITLFSC